MREESVERKCREGIGGRESGNKQFITSTDEDAI